MTINTMDKPIEILLAEDDEDDVEIAIMAFKRSKLLNNINVVNDGEEALDYIYNRGDYQDTEKYTHPDLLLLDINMPKKSGLEVLDTIMKDPKLRGLRVIMLTSSKNDEDIINSYDKGACAFVPKPVEFTDFLKVVEGLNLFWHTVIFPNKR